MVNLNVSTISSSLGTLVAMIIAAVVSHVLTKKRKSDENTKEDIDQLEQKVKKIDRLDQEVDEVSENIEQVSKNVNKLEEIVENNQNIITGVNGDGNSPGLSNLMLNVRDKLDQIQKQALTKEDLEEIKNNIKDNMAREEKVEELFEKVENKADKEEVEEIKKKIEKN